MLNSLCLDGGRLSEPHKQAYWRDGYLFPIPVMSPAEAQDLRAELEALEAEWLDNGLPLPLNTYKMVNAHCVMPMAHRVATDPRVLDVVEGIIGPDIMVWSVEFFIKEPNSRHIVSMHQDLTYWGFGAVDHLVTAWIALSPATPASGCMNFVKGSHKNPIMPHEDTHADDNLLSRGQEIKVDVASEDKQAIEIHPGQMSLHHGLTIHGSDPNTTDDRRIACVVRYLSPQIAQKVADRDYAMLARGADRTGNFINFAPPEAAFSPQSLVLYDEIRKAQAQALMQGAKADKGRLYG
ncbi:MAG: phytanoyl-CoA dioxygenase family protein [Roseovarius sp.]